MATGSGWNDSTPRFREERKPLVERPNVLMVGVCWCGESHGYKDTPEGAVPRTHWESLEMEGSL